MPEFVPGLELAESLYVEGVRPVLEADFPGVAHEAALIGPGSEVLGFDDQTSTDHHWGPRLMLFLRPEDDARLAKPIRRRLRERLPTSVRGWPTNFTRPNAEGTQFPQAVERGPVRHRVSVLSWQGFCVAFLAWDANAALEAADWLSFPQQTLRSIAAGRVFHDDVDLEAARGRLRWYPDDVWRYLLAAAWLRISQEEAFMGRSGSLGDELGSRLIAGRLVRDVMRLGFLMERVYAPYSKWFGRAFRELDCAAALRPRLEAVLAAGTWQAREAELDVVYAEVARRHNALGLTEPLPQATSAFHDRAFRVIHGERFSRSLLATLRDPEVQRIASHRPIGSIDLFSDSTDLAAPAWRSRLRALYAE